MPMTGKGLSKLIEECGELVQVAGKKLAYYSTDAHPDRGRPLHERLEDEIADVLAAAELVIALHGLNDDRIRMRRSMKLDLFMSWHRETENNVHGIDASPALYVPRHVTTLEGDCVPWCRGCQWRTCNGKPLDWEPEGEGAGG